MNPRELYPLARVPREPALSIGQVADRLQKTYEDYHGGLLSAEEAGVNQALLTKSVHTRLTHSGSTTEPAIVGPPQSVCTNVLWFDLDSRQRTYREKTSRGRRHA
jgi:hypothetical protein